MRTITKILLLVIPALLIGACPLHAYKKVKCFMPQTPELVLDGVQKVAVLDLKGSSPTDEQVGRFIADKMIEYLLMDNRGIGEISGGFFGSKREGVTLVDGVGTNCFAVVERSRMSALMAEQGIGEAGLVSAEEAARIGELAGVDIIITGDASSSATDQQLREVHQTYQNRQKVQYTANCVKRSVKVVANIRIEDVRTGEILSVKNTSRVLDDKVCDDESKKLRDAGVMLGDCAADIAWEFTSMISPWYDLEEFELDKIKLDETKDKADDAAKAAEKYELGKAYAIYNGLYESDPYNPQYMYNMGVLYEVTGDFNKAKEMYEGAASLKDDDRYKDSVKRITARAGLVPFYESIGRTIVPRDFEAAASDASLTAEKVKVKGGEKERIPIYMEADASSDVVAKVPGGVQLEVIETKGDWIRVKLLGNKEGYIQKGDVED
jgi:hypothetical protein